MSSRCRPAVESGTDAAVTTTASSKPRVSVAMCRLRPLILFAPSDVETDGEALLAAAGDGVGVTLSRGPGRGPWLLWARR
ncbi:hypothetical protein C5N14_27410 [Micromonospora sp. MW-13]|nr:hypothetical protein C5N14_27410 [Micromonospora sp. MW-13]